MNQPQQQESEGVMKLPKDVEERFDELIDDNWWTIDDPEARSMISTTAKIKHFIAQELERQRQEYVEAVKNRKVTIKWLWGKQKTDDECFLMVMKQVQKIADIFNGKDTNE